MENYSMEGSEIVHFGNIDECAQRLARIEETIVEGNAKLLMGEQGMDERQAYDTAVLNRLIKRYYESYPNSCLDIQENVTSNDISNISESVLNSYPSSNDESSYAESGSQSPMMTFHNGKLFSKFMNPHDAGFSFEDSQRENYHELRDERELSRRKKEIDQDLYKHEKKNQLDIQMQLTLNVAEEEHKEHMLAIEQNAVVFNPNTGRISSLGTNLIGARNNIIALLERFVSERGIVRENKRRDTDDVILYMWDKEESIYFKISVQRLRLEIKDYFLTGNAEDIPLTDSKVAEFGDIIKHRLAPTISKSGLAIADGNQTFFRNGYYDIKEGKFVAGNTKNIFHTFCIPYDFDENAPDPDKYDEITNRMFNGDKERITLAYQILGALISDVRSIKCIYVLQGIPNSGKTTYASIALKLLDKREVKKLNTVNEITGDALKNLAKSVKVVCIKDSGHEALKVNSVSYLKSYASGDIDEDDVYFTMLLQTNNPIYSDKAGNIEKALYDRFLVLPFDQDLTQTDNGDQVNIVDDFMDNYFYKEKQGIVRKALEALHDVMKNGKKFVRKYPLNGCVGGTVNSSNTLMALNEPAKDKGQLRQLLKEFIETNFNLIDEKDFQANPKSGVDAPTFFKLVSMALSNTFANSNSLGKALKDITISEKSIKTKDFSDIRYYNLKLKV